MSEILANQKGDKINVLFLYMLFILICIDIYLELYSILFRVLDEYYAKKEMLGEQLEQLINNGNLKKPDNMVGSKNSSTTL